MFHVCLAKEHDDGLYLEEGFIWRRKGKINLHPSQRFNQASSYGMTQQEIFIFR
jgi:hypothetical protein